MDKFKTFVQENKAALDREMPDDSAWENIAGRIGHTQQQRKGAIWVKLGKIAAAAAVVAAVWLVYDLTLHPGGEKALPDGGAEGVTVRDIPGGGTYGKDSSAKVREYVAVTDGRESSGDDRQGVKGYEKGDVTGKADQPVKRTTGNSDKEKDRNHSQLKNSRYHVVQNSSTEPAKDRAAAQLKDIRVSKSPALKDEDCTLLADLDKIEKKILAAFNSPLLKENASCSATLKSQFAQITEREKQIRLYVDCKTENNLDHLLIIQQQKLFLLRQTEEQIRKMAIYADQPANIINSI